MGHLIQNPDFYVEEWAEHALTFNLRPGAAEGNASVSI